MRAAFMGSPEFAVPSLHAVRRRCDLQVVVCQPDRPAGRGRQLAPSPVKALASEQGIEVRQPLSLRDPETQEALRAL